MIHQNNLLLKRLEPAVLAIVSPHLSVVSLRLSELLADAHDRVQTSTFRTPESYPMSWHFRTAEPSKLP